jgi:hypothetical protein
MLTTHGIRPAELDEDPGLERMPAGPTVIDPPVLEEGVDIGSLIEAEAAAKQGIIRSLNATRTYMKKLQQVQQDAGTWCAPRGVANPVSAIGGSQLSSKLTTELQKIFDRYVAAINKGVDTTLAGLSAPLS